MWTVALLKNYRFEDDVEYEDQGAIYNFIYTKILTPVTVPIMIGLYPLIMIPAFRFYLLRKARGLGKITIKKKIVDPVDQAKEVEAILERDSAQYGRDICDAFKFWSNQPLIDAYYNSQQFNKKEVEEMNKLRQQSALVRQTSNVLMSRASASVSPKTNDKTLISSIPHEDNQAGINHTTGNTTTDWSPSNGGSFLDGEKKRFKTEKSGNHVSFAVEEVESKGEGDDDDIVEDLDRAGNFVQMKQIDRQTLDKEILEHR